MDYMLLVYCDERLTPDIEEAMHGQKACEGLVSKLVGEGKFIAGDRLHPVATATSVQMRDGSRLVTDGPFAETREQLAGYLLVTAANLDDAIRIASEHPVAAYGTIEVRPILAMPAPVAASH